MEKKIIWRVLLPCGPLCFRRKEGVAYDMTLSFFPMIEGLVLPSKEWRLLAAAIGSYSFFVEGRFLSFLLLLEGRAALALLLPDRSVMVSPFFFSSFFPRRREEILQSYYIFFPPTSRKEAIGVPLRRVIDRGNFPPPPRRR